MASPKIAYIGIGANLGDRQGNCEAAVRMLKAEGLVRVADCSGWYETEPLVPNGEDPTRVNKFINGAVKIETELDPKELLGLLKKIETALGRDLSAQKWAPRPIDLDILFYDDIVTAEDGLVIPHPELHKRTFVLRPLCDIAPALVHPVFGRTVANLKEGLL